jgi:hypothetical protein
VKEAPFIYDKVLASLPEGERVSLRIQ